MSTWTRKNNEEIVRIEEEISKLTEELVKLVRPTEDEMLCTVEQIADMSFNELKDGALGDLFIAQDALDQRECIEEEE